MFPESAKQGQAGAEGAPKPGTGRLLDREVRDMVNAITHHVADLHHRPGGPHQQHYREVEEDDQQGVRIVTLAGTNMGASMRSELGDKSVASADRRKGNDDEEEEEDDDDDAGDSEAGTYVNSNFQAVNNSIMMSSSYNTNDPGVRLDITDVFEQPHHGHKVDKHLRKQLMGKRKEKAALPTDQHFSAAARSD